MEYSSSLLIEALFNYSYWFSLYFIVYGILILFVGITGLAILGGFLGFISSRHVILAIMAVFILLIGFPKPQLFGFVEVKGKYVEAIKQQIHKDSVEKMNSRDINSLLQYKFNEQDSFNTQFTKSLSIFLPKKLDYSMRDIDDELYSEYKACFITKNKPNQDGSMTINAIYQEIYEDKVNCTRKAAVSFLQPARIERFIKNNS